MIRHSHRSSSNVNQLGTYTARDARMDHPHLPAHSLATVVREVRELRSSLKPRRQPLSAAVRRVRANNCH